MLYASGSPLSSDDDVICLGTAPRRKQPNIVAAKPRTLQASRCTSIRDGRRGSSQLSGRRPQQNTRLKSKMSNSPSKKGIRHKPRARQRAAVPSIILRKLVKIGRPRQSAGQLQPVYGSFDRAGRFCCWVSAGGSQCPPGGRPSGMGLKPIAHDAVEYSQRFQGMTREQVRSEVYGMLVSRYGPVLEDGVI
jgi:hypothetical protein